MSQKSNGWYWVGLLALIGGMVFYADAKDIVGVQEEYKQSEVRLQRVTTQVEELTIEKATLNRAIEKLGTDSFSMEERIRQDGEKVRRGETVYRIELPESE